MTPTGFSQLKAELRELKLERPKLAEVILRAREHGDISENAEFDAAKEKQAFMEGRIGELEAKLAQSEVIDPAKLSGERVVFGATVSLEDVDSGDTSVYQIVGDDEADVKAGKISVSSPIARAIMAKNEGDEVAVTVPGGQRTFEISNVEFLASAESA